MSAGPARILVTGATGFLGSALCPALRQSGAEVVALGSRDADLTDPTSLAKVGTGRFDRIYHLAAWTQAGDFCLRHPGEQWLINQQINTTVLRYWAEVSPKRSWYRSAPAAPMPREVATRKRSIWREPRRRACSPTR